MFPTWRASLGGFWEERVSSWLVLCATWWATTSSASPSVFRWCLQPRWGSSVGTNCHKLKFKSPFLLLFALKTVLSPHRAVDGTHSLCADAVNLLHHLFVQTRLEESFGGGVSDPRSSKNEQSVSYLQQTDLILLKQIQFKMVSSVFHHPLNSFCHVAVPYCKRRQWTN